MEARTRLAYHRIIDSTSSNNSHEEQWMRQTALEWVMVAAAAAALVACERSAEMPRTSMTQVAPAATAPTEAPTPPAGDASVPPADAAPAPKSGDGLPATAGKSDVTSREKDQRMPLPGQANDHSTPDFEKRGDGKPGK